MTLAVSPEAFFQGEPDNDYQQMVLDASDEIRATLFFRNIVPDWKLLADFDVTPELHNSWYYQKQTNPDFSPAIFAKENGFIISKRLEHTAAPGETIESHLSKMWNHLMRDMSLPTPTRLALPNKHVVPGDRFDEAYYWDSYFAMLGLATEGRWDDIRGMVDNFAHLLEEHGKIPNGNRSYYLNRSQPPFFAKMVELLAQHDGDLAYVKYCPALETEYNFWMDGIDDIQPGEAHRRLVCEPDGSLYNRNFCDTDTPRPEMVPHDILMAHVGKTILGRTPKETYREIGTICERGEDMNGITLEDGQNLYTANATSILPVALNGQIYNLERVLARAHSLASNRGRAGLFEQRVAARAIAIERRFWNEQKGYYFDYNFVQRQQVGIVALTGLSPLYFGLAQSQRGERALQVVRKNLVYDVGGAANNILNSSEHQWDGRRFWSFTNEMAIVAARRYGDYGLAARIGAGFLRVVRQGFHETGQFKEKYCLPDANGSVIACAGEYADTPSGFAPTNGVVQALVKARSTPELQFWLHGQG